MLIEIGTIIKKYQDQNNINVNNNARLLKAKEVIELYPILTSYALNDAVKRGLIPIVKRGKLNFYDSSDIEKYINELKKNNSNEIEIIKQKDLSQSRRFV